VSTPGAGYQIILRSPPKATGDLQGMKVRGTPTYGGVFKMLGASPVVLPPAEIYTSLEKGLVDGAAWPTFGVAPYRWNEVSKHLLRPAFGTTTQLFFVNTATWNKLSAADKDIITKEITKAEDLYTKLYDEVTSAEQKELVGKGMTIVQMGDSQKARLGDAWSNGLWELTAQKNPKDVDALRKFGIAKGLAK
jgi:TRAP-type C4-dicarboxylate transport system substrate-binding protein